MIRIGFVLLTHSHPDQVLTLTRVLNELYDDPPIVCHHDFGQCALDLSKFTDNVRFVRPHFHTFWGCFSIVPAALAAIRLLMQGDDAPDWFYLLSGSDYPTVSSDVVREFLARSPFDAFIDHREIRWPLTAAQDNATALSGFNRPSYRALAYKRYCAVAVPRPAKAKPFAIPPVGRIYLRDPRWRALVPGPFSEDFRCYAGEHWFTANAKAANVLLEQTARSERLFAHLKRRESPEECFYHSLLGNSGLRLSTDNLRYIDWSSPDAWHPKSLGAEDVMAIRHSKAHFARKIAPGSSLVPELDRILGTHQPVA